MVFKHHIMRVRLSQVLRVRDNAPFSSLEAYNKNNSPFMASSLKESFLNINKSLDSLKTSKQLIQSKLTKIEVNMTQQFAGHKRNITEARSLLMKEYQTTSDLIQKLNRKMNFLRILLASFCHIMTGVGGILIFISKDKK